LLAAHSFFCYQHLFPLHHRCKSDFVIFLTLVEKTNKKTNLINSNQRLVIAKKSAELCAQGCFEAICFINYNIFSIHKSDGFVPRHDANTEINFVIPVLLKFSFQIFVGI
jgi:hypothetical protein